MSEVAKKCLLKLVLVVTSHVLHQGAFEVGTNRNVIRIPQVHVTKN